MINGQENKKGLTRREFFGIGLAVSLFGLASQASVALLGFFRPRYKPGSFGAVVVAGQVDEFEPGTVSYVRGARCYIARLEDGGFLALWQRCTHLGCTVPWLEEDDRFNCPCHSSIFNVVGEVLTGPAPRPLDLFSIEIIEGQVLVNTGDPVLRDSFDPSQVTYA